MNENRNAEEVQDSPGPQDRLDNAPEKMSLDHITVVNVLLRDALAMRQRLFSYLQFYLTAQAGLAALFGIAANDAHEALQSPSAKIALLLSTLGILASFLVFGYGLLMLRPGSDSREWISRQLEQSGHFGEIPAWANACQRRLEWLLSANRVLDKKVTWIRIGILIQRAK